MNLPDLDDWQPWSPDDVIQKLAAVNAHWYVVGGWAIDLWLGHTTRVHGDIEICTLRENLSQFQFALPMCEFYAAGGGVVTALLGGPPADDIHQIWCLDRNTRKWKLDIMLEPGTAETWSYKRDISFQFPRDEIVVRTNGGVLVLRPEAVLLFKAKATRPKDDVDFEACLPRLERPEWLAGALQRFHPEHPWRDRLRRKI